MFIGIVMMTSLIIHPMSKSWMHKCLKRNPWCQNYLLIMSKSLTREIIPVHLPMPNQPLFQFMWWMVMQFNIIVFNTFKKGFELVENIIFALSGYRLEAAFSEIRSQDLQRENILERSQSGCCQVYQFFTNFLKLLPSFYLLEPKKVFLQ